MMLSTVVMVVLIVVVLIAGALCGVIFNYLQNQNKQKSSFIPPSIPIHFSENSTYGRMKNSDVNIDKIIKEFKLLD